MNITYLLGVEMLRLHGQMRRTFSWLEICWKWDSAFVADGSGVCEIDPVEVVTICCVGASMLGATGGSR